jgi:hypothetical protein
MTIFWAVSFKQLLYEQLFCMNNNKDLNKYLVIQVFLVVVLLLFILYLIFFLSK